MTIATPVLIANACYLQFAANCVNVDNTWLVSMFLRQAFLPFRDAFAGAIALLKQLCPHDATLPLKQRQGVVQIKAERAAVPPHGVTCVHVRTSSMLPHLTSVDVGASCAVQPLMLKTITLSNCGSC